MKKYDLIVVGGGISGIAASVSAAREGLGVLLIENSGNLGGAITKNLVYPFVQYKTYGKKTFLCDGIFTEIRARHEAYGDKSWETFKIIFDEMVTEAGVDVLFHATVYEAIKSGRKITGLKVTTGFENLEVCGDYFIDATGDGNLIAMTNCDFQLGREADSLCQPMTTCFRMGKVNLDLFKEEFPVLQEKYKKLREENKLINKRENILVFYGLGDDTIHFNSTRVVMHNPVDAIERSKAEILGRKQVGELIKFLKENSKAFENASLLNVASAIGVRESRKLKGVYVINEKDLIEFKDFDDTIALGNYGIDIHNPSGTGTTQHHFKDEEFYRIPYRALLPKELDNMLVCGRCLSATHEAHSAVRIMPICACLGQAAGTGIAVAKQAGVNTHSVDVKLLQEKLKENGANIM